VRVSASANAVLRERKQIGSDGRFKTAPTKIVAVRQIAFSVQDPPFGPGNFTKLRINDTVSRDNLIVEWEGVQFAFFETAVKGGSEPSILVVPTASNRGLSAFTASGATSNDRP
jgi:hypothetical protein